MNREGVLTMGVPTEDKDSSSENLREGISGTSPDKHNQLAIRRQVVSLQQYIVPERTLAAEHFMEFFPDPVKAPVIISRCDRWSCHIHHHAKEIDERIFERGPGAA